MIFVVVSGESQPDHSTLAAFVSKLGDEVARLFAQVLVLFFLDKRSTDQPDVLAAIRQRIDSDEGKRMITRRFATVEPVIGNLRDNKSLSSFTLRGKAKVDGQFKLYAMMHNIEKFAGSGYAQ